MCTTSVPIQLPDANVPPVYLTAHAVARLLHSDHRTIAQQIKPDAWYTSPKGKQWPLYLPESVERLAAQRSAGGAR